MKVYRSRSPSLSWLIFMSAVANFMVLLVWPRMIVLLRCEAVRQTVSGCVAGLLGLLVVYPLDTAKVQMQTSRPGTYTGFCDAIQKTYSEFGVRGLYRGVLSPAVGCGVIFSTTFCTYSLAIRWLIQIHHGGEPRLCDMMIAGLLSGLTSSIPRAAFERVKSVMQVSTLPGAACYDNSMQCFIAICQKEGLAGLFCGLMSTMARQGPQQIVYFPAFELAAQLLRRAGAEQVFPVMLLTLIPGAFAGVATWLPPFIWVDAVNSRLQTAQTDSAKLRVGFWQCASEMYRSEGSAAFNRGLAAALARAAPMHATIFCVRGAVASWLSSHGF
eukprot:TRINITY_DN104654_c0_g1_i1.p1 TRINITY_DN104654_c0_g1~~TRINITY_DN104654_c0_g1_i1.p1  ORF type:complete len:345 (+),score=39.64 TRINITY_DN104654_c0_g1_i1:54-1037(+)